MLVKGPFYLKWGENPILNVSELAFNYNVNSNDYETVDGRTYHVDGAIDCSIDITLLQSDVEALSVVLSQYYVPKGGTMSTGETVTADEGAIDIVAAKCDTTDVKYPLDITSCNGEVTRLVNAKTSLSTVDIDNNALRTVTITFRGEPDYNEITKGVEGILQFFKEGGITES